MVAVSGNENQQAFPLANQSYSVSNGIQQRLLVEQTSTFISYLKNAPQVTRSVHVGDHSVIAECNGAGVEE